MKQAENNGYQTYLQYFEAHKQGLVEQIVKDCKEHGRNLEGALERAEWLYNFARQQPGEGVFSIISEAASRLEMEKDAEINAALTRPFQDNNVHQKDQFREPLFNKRLFLGAVLQAGGRIKLDQDIQRIVAEMSEEELARTSFEFIQQADRVNDDYIQVTQADRERSELRATSQEDTVMFEGFPNGPHDTAGHPVFNKTPGNGKYGDFNLKGGRNQ